MKEKIEYFNSNVDFFVLLKKFKCTPENIQQNAHVPFIKRQTFKTKTQTHIE